MKIDNFALTMNQACPAKFDLRMNQGWTVRHRSAALGFGGAIHAGLAEWYRTGDPGAALTSIESAWDSSVPAHDYRTLNKCLEVMAGYIKHYPHDTFKVVGQATGNPIIERTFTLETGLYLPCSLSFLPTRMVKVDDVFVLEPDADPVRRKCTAPSENVDEVCGCGRAKEPLEYGGIFDGLVEASGHVYILEHKSTSQLGSYYFNQFKPNNQVTGYIWAASKMTSMKVAGAIINAIGVYKASPTKFERHITARNDFEIAEWLGNVYYECVAICRQRADNHWPLRTPSCTQYGACEFLDVHSINDPKHRLKRLEQDYIKDPWNYEERD